MKVKNNQVFVENRRKYGVSVEEVVGYIARGRRQVLGDPRFDRYLRYRTPEEMNAAMTMDAYAIAKWFNVRRHSFTDAEISVLDRQILDIQHGPSCYLQKLLATELSDIHFKAARSWAERERLIPGSVNMDAAPILKDVLLKLLDDQIDLGNWGDQRTALGEVLVFAFYGLERTPQGQSTRKLDRIDL